MEEYRYKPDGQLIELAAATAAASSKEFPISVDESYDEIIGIEAHEISDGGSPYYRIGFKDETSNYLPLTHKDVIMSNASVAQSSKARAIDNAKIRKGKTFTLTVYNDLVLGTKLRFEIVFLLRRKVTPTQ